MNIYYQKDNVVLQECNDGKERSTAGVLIPPKVWSFTNLDEMEIDWNKFPAPSTINQLKPGNLVGVNLENKDKKIIHISCQLLIMILTLVMSQM